MKLGEFPKFHFHHPTIVFYLRILKEPLRIKKKHVFFHVKNFCAQVPDHFQMEFA